MDETHSELTRISTLQKTVLFKIDKTNEYSSRSLDKSLTDISDITDLTVSKACKFNMNNENDNNKDEDVSSLSDERIATKVGEQSNITVIVTQDLEKSTSLSSEKQNQIDDVNDINEEVIIPVDSTNDDTEKSCDLDQTVNQEITAPEENQEINAPEENQEINAPEENQEINAPEENQEIDNPEENQKIDNPEENQEIDNPEENQEIDNPEENQETELSDTKDDKNRLVNTMSLLSPVSSEDKYEKSKILPQSFVPISEEISEDAEKLSANRQSLLAKIHLAMQERRILTKTNETLQSELWTIFRKRKADAAMKMQKILRLQESAIVDTDQRYKQYLHMIVEMQKKLHTIDEDKKKYIDIYDKEFKNIEAVIISKTNELTAYRHQLALTAANSHTGKKLPSSEWETMMTNENKKNLEVQSVRLECIKLQNTVNKLRAAIASKEIIGNKISLMDFEQIKIENQALNEKLADGQEARRKLRIKIQNNIHILTQLKEKINFGISEVEKTIEYDKENRNFVNAARRQLTKLKHSRDHINKNNEKIIRTGGLLNRAGLLKHFDFIVDKIEKQKDNIRKMSEITISNQKPVK